MPDRDRADARKIHIRLSPELHRRLRIRCAELDVTIQDFVVDLLETGLETPRGETGGSATTRSRGRGGAGGAE